jgi:tetratricopeptide (TPR) repeat protein
LLAETGWTGDALARAVNTVGAETGLKLRYQRASVTHWLSGMRPRPPVPELVAEAFSRRLGRRVTVGETALGPAADAPDTPGGRQWWQVDVVTRLAELAGSGAPRRDFLSGCVYSLAALSVPRWGELSTACRTSEDTFDGKVGRAEVASAALMFGVFSDADVTFGGGRARPALSAYLGSSVAPLLRADATPAVRRELFSVAARLTYLFGFMCFDDELHGAAERYYLTSLRLAVEAGDPVCYAAGLRQLSVQARSLGHQQLAVQLAEAAVRTAARTATPTERAFLIGQLAVAHAAGGDRHAALKNLARAEQELQRSSNGQTPVAAYHSASLAHQHAAVAACLGDRREATAALTRSVRHRPADERRSRAITLAKLAELRWADGHLEQACQTWHRFLDIYPCLRSQRAVTALAALRATTRPHERVPAVRALRQRASTQSRSWTVPS